MLYSADANWNLYCPKPQHDIPVVENPPIARALYDNVELDQAIPAEHYKAVAEIIGYVMRLKGKLPGLRGAQRS